MTEFSAKLDLTKLEKSVAAVRASLNKSDDEDFMRTLDDVARDTFIAGVIQHFEFTYEQCWKFMKRWIENQVSPDAVKLVPMFELFRRAAEAELIDDVEKWMKYHDARNRTTHTYEEQTAEEVYETIHEFVPDAEKFLAELRKQNEN